MHLIFSQKDGKRTFPFLCISLFCIAVLGVHISAPFPLYYSYKFKMSYG